MRDKLKFLPPKRNMTIKWKTNAWVLTGIAGIFICTTALGEQPFFEMMRAAETNCGPIVVELGMIDYCQKHESNHTAVTVSPKNSDYTSTEKWYISGEKYRREQSFSPPFKNLDFQSIVSANDGTEFKQIRIVPLPVKKIFGVCVQGGGTVEHELWQNVFGYLGNPCGVLTNASITTNFVENGVAVFGLTRVDKAPVRMEIRLEIATNSGFVKFMQIAGGNGTTVSNSHRVESEITKWGSSSNWFPSVHRFFYGNMLAKEVFVKSVQFNAKISNEVFQLSFPSGTSVFKDGQRSIQP